MSREDLPTQDEERTGVRPPPLGGWSRLYLLVAILAIAVMLGLWLVATTFNIRMPK